MKVIDNTYSPQYRTLESVPAGAAMRFRHSFNSSNCKRGDVFIRLSMSNCYLPEKDQYRGKVALMNCSNGRVSWVCGQTHECEQVHAELTIERCC